MTETSILNATSYNSYGYTQTREQQKSVIEQRSTEGLRTDRVSLSYETANKADRSANAADAPKKNQSVVFRRMEEAAKKEATGDYAQLTPGQLFSTIA